MAPLPNSKDQTLFRSVLSFYENKQYKKGLKTAEQILRRNPKHGETLAMKGLIINCLGRTDEAFTIVKDALKLDMKSHVCWHVYGLLWRSVKNFGEAIKAYKFALKLEPDSANILRDLALLQAQMRDWNGYVESRRLMLGQKPNLRMNWTGLAVALHMSGNYEEAEGILTKYEESLKVQPPKDDLEHAEALLYKNMIIAESGQTERALEHLLSIEGRMLDVSSTLEYKASYLLKLGRNEEACEVYRTLLGRNGDNRAYYKGLEEAKGIKEDDVAARKKLYEGLAEVHPFADAPRRVPLDFLSGDEYREAAEKYIIRLIKKGAPSAFLSIKAVYKDTSKQAITLKVVEDFLAETRANPPADDASEADKTRHTENIVWALYFIALHYDYYRTRNLDLAFKTIDEAIELDPTLPELYMSKAKMYKHAGDLKKAAETMNTARELEKSDRYLNTKCSKYTLRADDNEGGLKLMSLFTRNEAAGGTLGDLLEMQCIWYLTEDGEAYMRKNMLGLALKRFSQVHKIFEDWHEDQFDFHSFSLRKGQIRSYVAMLRWEDQLRHHVFFRRAAIDACKVYTLLADQPHLGHASLSMGQLAEDFEKLSTAEKKKAMKKAKREQQKEEEKRKEEAAKRKDEANGKADDKVVDTDPKGEELVHTTTPLEDALKFLNPLVEFNPEFVEVQAIAFEVQIRRKKYALALKALVAGHKLAPNDGRVHEQLIRFRKIVDSLPSEPTDAEPLSDVLIAEFNALLPKDTNVVEYNQQYLEKEATNFINLRYGLQAKFFLNPEKKDEAAAELVKAVDLEECDIKEAVEGLKVLREWKASDEVLNKYKEAGRGRWPQATAFQA
ncbi:N-terminal acetyltransferase catalytic subunit [Ascobolus immersus RN42]|uniref:N-terminal acetyltransferase catalytic subunit n=1 Tax=Ascobolus immersus RN42 TaxID=1160509 RepID=A0A3N4I089_ASCIM|nr:N-terminal acetyltransferase catalytic subunit [Ascobolus immersus RN42]